VNPGSRKDDGVGELESRELANRHCFCGNGCINLNNLGHVEHQMPLINLIGIACPDQKFDPSDSRNEKLFVPIELLRRIFGFLREIDQNVRVDERFHPER
jgi:hypothetical protein